VELWHDTDPMAAAAGVAGAAVNAVADAADGPAGDGVRGDGPPSSQVKPSGGPA
jgi:hypothetical protein